MKNVKGLFLAIAFAVSGMAAASLPACTTVQQYAPKTIKQAVAEAEVTFTGVVTVASELDRAGYLSPDQKAALVKTFEAIGDGLDKVENLLRIGDEAAANAELLGVSPKLASVLAVVAALTKGQ